MATENLDLKKSFDEYFSSISKKVLCDKEVKDSRLIIEWIESAFYMGAKIIVQDTLDTLHDYSSFVSGITTPTYNPEQSFCNVADNLKIYYDKILNNIKEN